MVRFALSAMMPGSDQLPALRDLGLTTYVDELATDASWTFWMGTVLCSAGFMVTPFMTIYIPLPAALLSSSQLDRHAMAMANHRIYLLRQAAMMVKMVAGLRWAASKEVRSHLGLIAYAPDPDSWRTS
jgi:hypothetical protein